MDEQKAAPTGTVKVNKPAGRVSRRTVVLAAGAAAGGLAVSRVLGLHKLGPDPLALLDPTVRSGREHEGLGQPARQAGGPGRAAPPPRDVRDDEGPVRRGGEGRLREDPRQAHRDAGRAAQGSRRRRRRVAGQTDQRDRAPVVVARPDAVDPDAVRRADDVLLARTLHQRLPQGHDAGAVHLLAEPDLAQERARHDPRHAVPGHRRPGHAALPRSRAEHREGAERELLPRAHGALHDGRRHVHRGRRPRRREGPRRLARAAHPGDGRLPRRARAAAGPHRAEEPRRRHR